MLVELGYFVVQLFGHYSQKLFWEHYGWWASLVILVVFWAIDLIADDLVKDRYFYDHDE